MVLFNNEPFHMTRLLIADTHAAFRASLLLYIASDYPDLYLGQAKDFTTLMEKTREQKWDLIFMDIKLYRTKGIEIVHHVEFAFPNTLIYITGMYEVDYLKGKLPGPGISGYISKDCIHEQFTRLVEKSKANIS